MKKYISALLFTLFFAGFLALQVAFDLSDSSARLSSPSKKMELYYQDLYRNSGFTTVEGRKIRLKELKAPIVILNFWASWCIPCLEEFPSIVALKRRFNDQQVFVLGVNTDNADINKVIQKVTKRYNLNFPIVADQSGNIASKYMVSSLPFSIIFEHGKVLDIVYGKKNYGDKKLINRFVAAQIE